MPSHEPAAMIRHAAAALLIAGHFCAPARANDWIAELDAGGLVLRREPGIAPALAKS